MREIVIGTTHYTAFTRTDSNTIYINRISPRDETEYHWARQTGKATWKVMLFRQHVADFTGSDLQAAHLLKQLDDAAGLKPRITAC